MSEVERKVVNVSVRGAARGRGGRGRGGRGRGGRGRGGRGRGITRKPREIQPFIPLSEDKRKEIRDTMDAAFKILMHAVHDLTKQYKTVVLACASTKSALIKAKDVGEWKNVDVVTNAGELKGSYGDNSLLLIDLYFPGIVKDEPDEKKKEEYERNKAHAQNLWAFYTGKVDPQQSMIVFSPAKFHDKLVSFKRTGRLSIQNAIVKSRAGGFSPDKKKKTAFFIHTRDCGMSMILRLHGNNAQTRIPLHRSDIHRLVVCTPDKKTQHNFKVNQDSNEVSDFPQKDSRPDGDFVRICNMILSKSGAPQHEDNVNNSLQYRMGAKKKKMTGSKKKMSGAKGNRVVVKRKSSGAVHRKIARVIRDEYVNEEESSSSSDSD